MAGGIKMMAKTFLRRFFAAFIIFFSITSFIKAQSLENIPAAAHAGMVTSLAVSEDGYIISVGEDGYINLWNIETSAAETHFQLSPFPIVSLAKRPNSPHIAMIESDGMGLFRISAWDYLQNKKLFTLRFKDQLSQ
jgi:WD40 repeat protein